MGLMAQSKRGRAKGVGTVYRGNKALGRFSAHRGGHGSRRSMARSSPKIAHRRGQAIALSARTGGVGQFSRRGGGGYRGFKSKKQWRWAMANHKPWAHKKAHETAGGPVTRYRRLPASKHSGHKGARTG